MIIKWKIRYSESPCNEEAQKKCTWPMNILQKNITKGNKNMGKIRILENNCFGMEPVKMDFRKQSNKGDSSFLKSFLKIISV